MINKHFIIVSHLRQKKFLSARNCVWQWTDDPEEATLFSSEEKAHETLERLEPQAGDEETHMPEEVEFITLSLIEVGKDRYTKSPRLYVRALSQPTDDEWEALD